MELGQLGAPPLSPDHTETWLGCLEAWTAGQRRVALVRAEALVASLADLEHAERERFGLWLCERLFDDSHGWQGQFGGGLSPTVRGFERPIDWALSLHPLTTRVVVPYVVAACGRGESGRSLRWLCQCLVGLAGRLTPAAREDLDAALQSAVGPSASPRDALRRAASDDEVARRWLEMLDSEQIDWGSLGRE